MKKIVLLGILFCLTAPASEAGIVSRFFIPNNNYYYNNGYAAPNYRYKNSYHPSRYYQRYNNYYNVNPNPQYYNNYYGPARPTIYRTNRVRRIKGYINNNSEMPISNEITDLNKIERKVLRQTYSNEPAKTRIERLEERMFGAVQSGDLYDRYKVLRHMSNNNFYGNYAENSYTPPIFSGASGAGWKRTALDNFRNHLIGVPTGFTPAMDPAYMDYFEAERAMSGAGEDIDYRSNTGWYKSNTNRSSGMGVTILD